MRLDEAQDSTPILKEIEGRDSVTVLGEVSQVFGEEGSLRVFQTLTS